MYWNVLPENVEQLLSLDKLEKGAKVIAVIIGGLWVYFNYFKGRTYKPRLELKVTGKIVQKVEANYLLTIAQLKNAGLSKIKIKQEGTALLISSYQNLESTAKVLNVEYNHLAAFPVFEYHQWIEPGEQIEDQRLIVVPTIEDPILRVEVRIVCKRIVFRNIEWKSWSIVQPSSPSDDEESVSKKG